MNKSRKVLRWLFALIFLGSGVLHFVFPQVYLELIPAWMPEPEALVYASGLFEIIAGLFLFSSRNKHQGRRMALLLLIAFCPIHIHHVVQGGSQTAHFKFGMGAALIRLALQVLLVYLVFKLKNEPKPDADF